MFEIYIKAYQSINICGSLNNMYMNQSLTVSNLFFYFFSFAVTRHWQAADGTIHLYYCTMYTH